MTVFGQAHAIVESALNQAAKVLAGGLGPEYLDMMLFEVGGRRLVLRDYAATVDGGAEPVGDQPLG